MTDEVLAKVENWLWPRGERRDIWMIVDSARDKQIFPLLLACHLDYECLYAGTLPPPLGMAAPYLVRLEYEYRDTRRLLRGAWGKAWGVFLRCDLNMKGLRRHLRKFLVVQDPRGEKLMFRYYDPRVLRIYLPTCTSEELRTVFGPIERFYVDGQQPDTLIQFEVHNGKLISTELPKPSLGA